MKKVIPITEQFRHFLEEVKESFCGDVYKRTRLAWERFLQSVSLQDRNRYLGGRRERAGKQGSESVRCMLAPVEATAPFDHGREQMEALAGLEVTTKAVERTAEAIGGDIAQGEQREIQRALPLDLPAVVGESVPICMYKWMRWGYLW